MWISKRRWLEVEKKIADLEGQIQSQQQFNLFPCRIGHPQLLVDEAVREIRESPPGQPFRADIDNDRPIRLKNE